MDVKQFRIGNYINYLIIDALDERKQWYELSKIDASDLDVLQAGLDYDYKLIPLTEELLLKFGFVSNPYQDRFEKGNLYVECDKIKGNTKLWISGSPHIKYIHQLQNLYFALTNEELIIK